MSEVKEFNLSSYLKEHRIPATKTNENAAKLLMVQSNTLLPKIRELNAAVNNALNSLDKEAYGDPSKFVLVKIHEINQRRDAVENEINLRYLISCENDALSMEFVTSMNIDTFIHNGDIMFEFNACGSVYNIPVSYHDGKYDTDLLKEFFMFNILFQRSVDSVEF